MTKWEYKLEDYTTGSMTGKEKALNRLGDEGWELVSCPSASAFAFKRKITTKTKSKKSNDK